MTQTVHLPTLNDAKAQAKRLRVQLQSDGNDISHSKSLELVASQHGYRDWNTFYAAIGNRPRALVSLGDGVTGVYLGQSIKGTIVSLETLNKGGWLKIGIELDTPVDVVTFDSFSSYRKRINATIGPDGRTKEKTSNGQPHLVLDL